jgi:cbb3-type cytochrome oxidase subunit 3
MRLSDIMAAAGLGGWAQAALVLFLLAFALLLVATLAPRRRAEFERTSRLPLGDDHPAPPRESSGDAA